MCALILIERVVTLQPDFGWKVTEIVIFLINLNVNSCPLTKELYSIVRKKSKTKDKYTNWDYYFYPGLEFELWLNLLHWFSFRSIDHKRKWQILKEQKRYIDRVPFFSYLTKHLLVSYGKYGKFYCSLTPCYHFGHCSELVVCSCTQIYCIIFYIAVIIHVSKTGYKIPLPLSPRRLLSSSDHRTTRSPLR